MNTTLAYLLPVAAVLLAAAAYAGELDVRQFGAVADDGKDDTAAFVAAFKALQAGPERRLVIPRGRYHLRADGNPERRGVLLGLHGVAGAVIDGTGAELMMSGTGGVFTFAQCRDLTVRGLSIDWERPPFSEGTVVAARAREFDVAVRPEYPAKGGEAVGAFMSYDPKTRLPAGGELDVYGGVSGTELVRPQVLRVRLEREIRVPVGTLLVLRHEVYGHNALGFHRCANVQASDVTVYAVGGMGLIAGQCREIAFTRVGVRLRPGSGRLMSATADATHFSGCQGTVTLTDCLFEGMGDDGANVKSGLYLTVRKRLDDRTVLAQHNLKMVDLPDPGDRMEMMPVATLLPYAARVVKSARIEPGEGRLHRVEFAEPLPPALAEGDVLGNATRVPRLRMQRCTVRANRARGLLCQTRDALIEDCLFQHCTGPGVLVLTEVAHFFESIGTRDVTVRNCRFEGCNFGAARSEAPVAALAWLKNGAHPPRPGVHKDVLFEGNRISGCPGSAIFAAGVDGFTARGNTIEGSCRRPAGGAGGVAIRVIHSSRVAVAGNTIDPAKQGPGFTAATNPPEKRKSP